MRNTARTLLLLVFLLAGRGAAAELVIVVHPDSGVDSMVQNDVVNVFMGRYQKLPSGITAFPVDLSPQRGAFYQQLVNKTLPEINSYWARLVFSGRASPPRQVQDDTEVIEIVSDNRGAIGYVDRSLVNDERVKIVFSFR